MKNKIVANLVRNINAHDNVWGKNLVPMDKDRTWGTIRVN